MHVFKMIRRWLAVTSVFAIALTAQAQELETESIAANSQAPRVKLVTNYGAIVLEMRPDRSPVTVANFLRYVDEGFYDGTIFHRVIPNFMVQGGGFTADLVQKETHEPIVNESKNRLHNVRGSVAMARTADPDSASAQFFINQRNNLRLDWAPGQPGYTVFAEVVEGMSVVDFIATANTQTVMGTTPQGEVPFSDVPVEPVILQSATRIN